MAEGFLVRVAKGHSVSLGGGRRLPSLGDPWHYYVSWLVGRVPYSGRNTLADAAIHGMPGPVGHDMFLVRQTALWARNTRVFVKEKTHQQT